MTLFALRNALVYQEFHHGIAQRPAQLFGHLDHGRPGAIDIAVGRQINRKPAADAPDLHAYDPEGQAGNLQSDIDEGVQALAVDGAQVRNRECHSFSVGVIGHRPGSFGSRALMLTGITAPGKCLGGVTRSGPDY
jgi:hypothetical protein